MQSDRAASVPTLLAALVLALGTIGCADRCPAPELEEGLVPVTAGIEFSTCYGDQNGPSLPGYGPSWVGGWAVSLPPGAATCDDGCVCWTPRAELVGQTFELVMQKGDSRCPSGELRLRLSVVAPPSIARFEVLTPDVRANESVRVIAEFANGEGTWEVRPDDAGWVAQQALGALESGVPASTPPLGGIGAVVPRTLRLHVRNAANTEVIADAQVNVWLAPTVTLRATPGAVYEGDAVQLAWTSSHASALEIAPGVGSVVGSEGAVTVVPAASAWYEITARNPLGESATATEGVSVAPLPSVTSFTTVPDPLVLGDAPTLTAGLANTWRAQVCRYEGRPELDPWLTCRSLGETTSSTYWSTSGGGWQDGTATYEYRLWTHDFGREVKRRFAVAVTGPGTFALARGPRAPRPGAPALALLADGRVLVAGGEAGGGDTAELLDAATLEPGEPVALQAGWSRAAAATLADGRVLVTGSAAEAAVEVVDPDARTSALFGEPRPPSAIPPAVLPLLDGSAVVVRDGLAERFDPGTGAFSAIPALSAAGARACRLADGRVLAARRGSFWTWDPATAFSGPAGSYAWVGWRSVDDWLDDGRPAAVVCLASGGALVLHFRMVDWTPTWECRGFLLDPDAGTSSYVQLSGACAGGAAQLADGRVLVLRSKRGQRNYDPATSGSTLDADAGATGSVVLDLATGAWAPTGRLDIARDAEVVTVLALPDGRALVNGIGHHAMAPVGEVLTPP